MEARRLRNKMEKGRGSVRLKFWQKTYLLTLALFLLALGGGTTAEALELIDKGRNAVRAMHGIELELEVVRWP